MRDLLTTDDLTDAEISGVLARASELAAGASSVAARPLVATLFLTASMRTRAGFAAAAHRIGGGALGVDELRFDTNMSAGESFEDALRVVAGMADVVVTRVPFDLDRELAARVPAIVINGGDRRHHPTQSLIDLAAIDLFGPTRNEARLVVCGDLTMRAARSFLDVLARRPPRSLTLVHPDSRAPAIPSALAAITTRADLANALDADVVSMIGLPPHAGDDHLDNAARAPFVLTGELIAALPNSAIVLSPMPVIDEVAADARGDHRIRMFEQSDHAVQVRAAILEMLLNSA